MIHPERVWHLRHVGRPGLLADFLAEVSWTRCTAFRIVDDGGHDVIFANDSAVEDGPQDYAVLRGDLQIDSIRVSSYTRDELLDHIVGILRAPNPDYPGWPFRSQAAASLDAHGDEHCCRLCL